MQPQQTARQAKILRPVMGAGGTPIHQGIKRNLSPTEVHQMQNGKRIKMEPMSPQDPYAEPRSGPNSPHQPQLQQQQQPNVVYIKQKMPDGQIRLVQATVIEQPGPNGRPVYVQTQTAPGGAGGVQNRMPQEAIMRRQVTFSTTF